MGKLNNNINLKSVLPFFLLAMTFMGLIIFFIAQAFFPTADLASIEKKEDWLYYTDSQPEATFTSNYVNVLPNVKANETFIMERKMTSDYQYPTLLMIGDHQRLTAYLDDEQFYTNDYTPGSFMTSHPGKTLSFVTLPQDYQGKTLRIYVSSPFDNFAGFPAEIYFGTANALIAYIFQHSIPNIFILLLTGLICIFNVFYVLWVYMRQRKIRLSALLFSGFALFAGLEAGFGDMLGGLLFRSSYNSLILNILMILTPMCLIGFYFSKMIYGRKYYGKWVLFHYLFGLAAISGGLIYPQQMPNMMNYILLLNIASTFITSFAAIYEAVKKNHFYVLCAPWVVVAAIGHCFIYILDVLHLRHSPVNWSSILFMMLVVVFTCYALLEHFFSHEEKTKENDTTSMKIRLYENQHSLFPHKTAKWHQTLDSIQQQTQLIKEMLEEQQLAAAFEGISVIEHHIDTHKMEQHEDMPSLLTMLLATYERKAANKSVRFDHTIDTTLFQRLHEDDLLPLFMHLLDYAFRHTYLLTDPKERRVSIRSVENNHQLILDCTFTVTEDGQIVGKSSDVMLKQDNRDLQEIKRILRSYQGEYSILHHEGTQKMRLILNS